MVIPRAALAEPSGHRLRYDPADKRTVARLVAIITSMSPHTVVLESAGGRVVAAPLVS